MESSSSLDSILSVDGPSSLASNDSDDDLQPLWFGHLSSKQDAVLLVATCPKNQYPTSATRRPEHLSSGQIYITEHCWSDGLDWKTIGCENDLLISQRPGLDKRTITINTRNRSYHVVSYCDPWQTVNGDLQTPFPLLRLPQSSFKHNEWLRNMLEQCSEVVREQFILNAKIVCCYYSSSHDQENLLRRSRNQWFPHLITRDDQCEKDLDQAFELVAALIPKTLITIPNRSFSYLQNRRLLGQAFGLEGDWSACPDQQDKASLCNKLKKYSGLELSPEALDEAMGRMTHHLALSPPASGSITMSRIMAQMTVEDCDEIAKLLSDYRHQFVGFTQEPSPMALFLVATHNAQICEESMEVIRGWIASSAGDRLYTYLLSRLQAALSHERMLLILFALAVFVLVKGCQSDNVIQRGDRIAMERLFCSPELGSGDVDTVRRLVWSFFLASSVRWYPEQRSTLDRIMMPIVKALHCEDLPKSESFMSYWNHRTQLPSHEDGMTYVWQKSTTAQKLHQTVISLSKRSRVVMKATLRGFGS